MDTQIFIFDKSWAIMSRLGVAKLAATVWPTSARREMTTPSTGAVMRQ